MIRSRARLLLVGNQRFEEADLPTKFWWAEGHEALEQDWALGDFSTWIDQMEQWEAFGVTFALSGMLEMLPVERRALVAHSFSVAGNADWVSANEARRFAYDKGCVNPTKAGSAVIEQAKLGFVSARAVLAQGSKGKSDQTEWNWDAREWDIPAWFWDGFAGEGSSSQDWASGRFSRRGKGPSGLRYFTLQGVHFLKDSLSVLLPATIATPVRSVSKNKGGRPPAAFADDLMCAIWGLIYQGDLEPKNQAEIERAMLDWALANDHELGATVARGKAQKVFAALKAEIGNPNK